MDHLESEVSNSIRSLGKRVQYLESEVSNYRATNSDSSSLTTAG